MAVEPREPRKAADKPGVDWRPEFAKVFATSAIAAIAAIAGSLFTYLGTKADVDAKYAQAERVAILENDTAIRDINLRMIDISLAILAGEKGGADEREEYDGYVLARDFAIRALSQASSIEISDEDRQKWAKAGALTLGTSPLLSATQTTEVNENAASVDFVFADPAKTRLSVCVGEYFNGCPEGVQNHFTCYTDIQTIIDMACTAGGTATRTLTRAGNRCGYAAFDIVCKV